MSTLAPAARPSPLWLTVKNVAFTLVAPGTLAVYLPRWLAGGAPAAAAGWHWLALAPFAGGAAIYTWCVWDFASFGHGTPAPIDAPRRLVVRGLYRWVRNPMYLGVLLAITGWALWFGQASLVGYAGIVALGFHTFVCVVEEPSLGAQFGPDYRDYRARVPRWIPRHPRP